MKDAVAAALGLNLFHRQADKLAMCNLAQVANVLQAPLLTSGRPCVRTPTFHTFALMKDHRGKNALRCDAPHKAAQELSVSASRDDRTLAVTLANPDPAADTSVRLIVADALPNTVLGWLLAHPDQNACNTVDVDTVAPRPLQPALTKNTITIPMPPLSVAHLRIMLH